MVDLIERGVQRTRRDSTIEAVRGGIPVIGSEGASGVVQMVRYNSTQIDVPTTRGENKGRILPLGNVVRDVTFLGTWIGGSQTFLVPDSEDKGLGRAVLIQAGMGGPISGAAHL